MARDLPEAVPLSEAEQKDLEQQTARSIGLLEQGEYEEARGLAEKILARDPRAARARAVRAMCLMVSAREEYPPRLNPWREAEGELRRAELIRPGDLVVGLYHARFLVADGHLTAAADHLDRLLVAHPRNAQALSLLGQVRYDLGDEHKAVDVCFDLISIVPEHAEAHYILAHCRMRMAGARADASERRTDFEQAQRYFARYSELRPGDPDGPLGEARALVANLVDLPVEDEVASQAAKSALDLYDGAARLDTRRPDPAFGRGVVLDYLHRSEDARSAYEASLELDPEYVPALVNLAANCEAAGMRRRALAYAQQALALQLSRSERTALQSFVDASPSEAEASGR